MYGAIIIQIDGDNLPNSLCDIYTEITPNENEWINEFTWRTYWSGRSFILTFIRTFSILPWVFHFLYTFRNFTLYNYNQMTYSIWHIITLNLIRYDIYSYVHNFVYINTTIAYFLSLDDVVVRRKLNSYKAIKHFYSNSWLDLHTWRFCRQ